MVKTKKVISIVLALVLMLSTCAFSAFAWTGTNQQEIKLEVEADKTTVQPGDTIKLAVKLYKNDAGTWENALAGFNISWFYNSSLITPESVEYGDIVKDFTQIRPVGRIVNAKAIKEAKEASTSGEQAIYEANGYNTICKIQALKDHNTPFGPQGYWESVDGMTLFTITLKVSDTAAAGSTIGFDMFSGLFAKRHTYLQSVDKSNKKATNKYGAAYYDSSDASVTFTVGTPAPAGPVVAKAKSQVKMTATGATTVADEFSFRVISKISDSDWDTYFKNTGVAGATTDYITAVGMVAYKGTAFDADTAKKVVAGTPAENYTAATTDYISKVSDTADAEFGAIIKANHLTLKNDVTYMGFVQYVDASGNAQTIFYETAGTAALSTNYDNIVNAYLTAYPYAA